MLALVLRRYGDEKLNFKKSEACFQFGNESSAENADLGELIHQLYDMEGRRNQGDFDVWELQALRNKINCMLREDPSLSRGQGDGR